MAGRSEIAGSRRMESDRRSSRREESRRSQLSPEMSRQPAPDNSNREVMASCHYLSRMPPDRSHTMEESRKLNEDRRQRPEIKVDLSRVPPAQSRTRGKSREVNEDRSPSVAEAVPAAVGAQSSNP